jgi:hypothetical protein
MRNLFALFGAALVAFFGAGWYLGWYQLEETPGAAGHRQVNIDFDNAKMSSDLEKGGARVEQAIDAKLGTGLSTVGAATPPNDANQ